MSVARTYDLIVGLGQACSCTQVLRANQLQFFSYPFDWLYAPDFMGKVDFLCNDFEGFLEFSDLSYIRPDPGHPHDVYTNLKSQWTFPHDFPLGMKLEYAFAEVKEKYDRRIHRLMSQLEGSKRVLFVYLQVSYGDPEEMTDALLLEGHRRLAQRFPQQKIDLLCFINEGEMPKGELSPHWLSCYVNRCALNYTRLTENDPVYVIDQASLKNALKGYRLTGWSKDALRRKMGKVFVLKRLKKGIGVYFLLCMAHILRIRISLWGLSLDISLGKLRG